MGRRTPSTSPSEIERMPAYEATESMTRSPSRTSARTSYRYGSSGDHSLGLGMGTRNSVSTVPIALPTVVEPLATVTRTEYPSAATAHGVTRRLLLVRSGVTSRRVKCGPGVGSNHTDCQIPETAV